MDEFVHPYRALSVAISATDLTWGFWGQIDFDFAAPTLCQELLNPETIRLFLPTIRTIAFTRIEALLPSEVVVREKSFYNVTLARLFPGENQMCWTKGGSQE